MMSKSGNEIPVNTVAAQCRAVGLEVANVERRGTVLVLHPAGDQTVPSSSALRQLANQLEIEGVRYVALGLGAQTQAAGGGDE